MLKIMDTDLTEALEVLAAFRPQLDRRGLAQSLHRMRKGDSRNYLFLGRADGCCLAPLDQVYEEGSPANLSWLTPFGEDQPVPDALLLQVRRAPKTRPRGNLSVLNSPDVALDVEVFSLLPCPADRESHLRAFLRVCAREAQPMAWAYYLKHVRGGEQVGDGR